MSSPATLPSVFSLAEAVRQLDEAYDVLDGRSVSPSASETERSHIRRAQELNLDRREALHHLIGTLPARNLTDAAAQVVVAWERCEELSASEWDDCSAKPQLRLLSRLLRSILPPLLEATGLKPEAVGAQQAMGWYAAEHVGEGAA